MSVREPNLSCVCGQPLDPTVASVSGHCTRCGLTIARSLARDGHLGAAPVRGPVRALLVGTGGEIGHHDHSGR
jgi:hypothetical protein